MNNSFTHRYLVVDSRNRTTDSASTADFRVNMRDSQIPGNLGLKSVKLMSALIPNVWHNVRADANTFLFTKSNADVQLITVPPGHYDTDTLSVTLNTLLQSANAAGTPSSSLTLVSFASNYRFEMMDDLGEINIDFSTVSNIAAPLGFMGGQNYSSTAFTITSPSVFAIADYGLFLQSQYVGHRFHGYPFAIAFPLRTDVVSGALSLQTAQTGFDMTHHFYKGERTGAAYFDLRVVDFSGRPVEFQGTHVQFTFELEFWK